MLKFKIDILEALKKKGYNTTKIRKDKLIAESTLQKIRAGEVDRLSGKNINTICILLRCQPGDILQEIPTDQEKIKYF